MNIPKFTDMTLLSNIEILEAIIKTKTELFHLRLKKATRQSFKNHQIKYAKHRLAQLKTCLTFNVNNLE